jgi:tRNA dimethylallyltransferase
MLRQIDPEATQRIHPNDPARTIRALEVAYVTGRPLSTQQGKNPPDYPVLYLGLDCEADSLKTRIETRTAQMIAQGLIQEVEVLCQRYGKELPLLKTLGYAEILDYLMGNRSLGEARCAIVHNTRQFAKRQRTWFRKRNIRWFDADDPGLSDRVWSTVKQFLCNVEADRP